MNIFEDSIKRELNTNLKTTENGAVAYKSTLTALYDMFALGGVYRNRSDEDCILLFKKAYEENAGLALKCLFYLRDVRGGQGERRYFRVVLHWLAKNYPEIVNLNIHNIPAYGRYDDLYCLVDTPCEQEMFAFVERQLKIDMSSLESGENIGVSLLAKWLKSENVPSKESRELGNKTRQYLGLTHKEYRKILSALRTRINIVEKLMSENRWGEIEFDKIPSKAGLTYRNAFARNDIIGDKYKEFMASKKTKVNAAALYPYEIVNRVTNKLLGSDLVSMSETEREALEKYWTNQPDYLEGKPCKMLCVVDTSGSMVYQGRGGVRPIDVAISLGMYCAERIGEPFKDFYISFSSRPQYVKIEGSDFVDKVRRIYQNSIIDSTDLTAVFSLLKKTIINNSIAVADRPSKIVVISDMEINQGSYWRYNAETEMEAIRKEWAEDGLTLPELVYWNVDARNDTILDSGDSVTFVSGCSPIIFKALMTGKNSQDLMLDILNSDRYEAVKMAE